MKVYKLDTFCKFAKKEHVSDADLLHALDAILQGNADANLGSFLYKQRVARQGKGTSGGYRVILCLRFDDKAFFLYGFSKSERSNINDRELLALKKQAKILLSLSAEIIESMLDDGVLMEIQSQESDHENI
ncbi:MAG: type II toxin-antitoxin system RelE/ParE family toxin [Selenomonas sp.]|nr:type II toxin-antitoxin system RelE/ParE family toxin [Selenomonas sp.]